MSHEGTLECLNNGFPDKRKPKTRIPFNLIIALSVAAKMEVKTSHTNIPYAINDHRTLAELGYNVRNNVSENGWFTEGTLCHLLGKYNSQDIFNY